MTSSEVRWQETGSDGGVATKADDSEGTSGRITDNTYTIGGLKSDTEYTITVIVFNPAGNTTSQLIMISTIENGNKYTHHPVVNLVEVKAVNYILGVIICVTPPLKKINYRSKSSKQYWCIANSTFD